MKLLSSHVNLRLCSHTTDNSINFSLNFTYFQTLRLQRTDHRSLLLLVIAVKGEVVLNVSYCYNYLKVNDSQVDANKDSYCLHRASFSVMF
jgi:hypothetical protein